MISRAAAIKMPKLITHALSYVPYLEWRFQQLTQEPLSFRARRQMPLSRPGPHTGWDLSTSKRGFSQRRWCLPSASRQNAFDSFGFSVIPFGKRVSWRLLQWSNRYKQSSTTHGASHCLHRLRQRPCLFFFGTFIPETAHWRESEFIHVLAVNIEEYTKDNQQAWPHVPKMEKEGWSNTLETVCM